MNRLQTIASRSLPSALKAPLMASLLASLVALSACSMMPMMSANRSTTTQLSGANEVPAVSSTATGKVDTTYNKDTGTLVWTITYSGLSGAATGGHFHGPAMAGANAPVVVPLKGSLASPISGSMVLTSAQADDLLAGKWYVNLHTAANPGGEIRGQVFGSN